MAFISGKHRGRRKGFSCNFLPRPFPCLVCLALFFRPDIPERPAAPHRHGGPQLSCRSALSPRCLLLCAAWRGAASERAAPERMQHCFMVSLCPCRSGAPWCAAAVGGPGLSSQNGRQVPRHAEKFPFPLGCRELGIRAPRRAMTPRCEDPGRACCYSLTCGWCQSLTRLPPPRPRDARAASASPFHQSGLRAAGSACLPRARCLLPLPGSLLLLALRSNGMPHYGRTVAD